MRGRRIWISCDDLDCDTEELIGEGPDTFRELEDRAAGEGWVQRRGKEYIEHYCPKHAAERAS